MNIDFEKAFEIINLAENTSADTLKCLVGMIIDIITAKDGTNAAQFLGDLIPIVASVNDECGAYVLKRA